MEINREIRYITAGDNNSISQAFYSNYFADSEPVKTNFFSYYKPGFYTYGGTLNYYGQDKHAIFTNLKKPPIKFIFTAHTESLSGNSYFVHEIYKLDYDIYKLYSDKQIDDATILSNKARVDGSVNGMVPANTKQKELINNLLIKPSDVLPEKFFKESLTPKDFQDIQAHFSNPIITLTASTSAITGFDYNLPIDQYIKRFGSYSSEFLKDKGQYFINTKIIFNINLEKNYSEFYTLNNLGKSRLSNWNDSIQLVSKNNENHIINSGPFSGINVVGNYFTYFIVPDKPKIEYPIMSGQLTTFTPEFSWSNGENSDYFLLQINYSLTDTGFTETVFNYPIEKSEKNTKTSRSMIDSSFEQFSTERNVFFCQIPIQSNKNFIYRIGNVKELIDVFDVKRTVITFSESYTATTQDKPIIGYVLTNSDSVYTGEISTFSRPDSIIFESLSETYVLSGIVTGSIVTGATMQLTYPNGNYVTKLTDSGGTYSFSGLNSGLYSITTNYRGYQQDVRTINLTGNTSESFKINLIWGNNVDTWGKMAGENYYI